MTINDGIHDGIDMGQAITTKTMAQGTSQGLDDFLPFWDVHRGQGYSVLTPSQMCIWYVNIIFPNHQEVVLISDRDTESFWIDFVHDLKHFGIQPSF